MGFRVVHGVGFWQTSRLMPKPVERDETPPSEAQLPPSPPQEIGGPPGPEPTRYGDWEKNGRCIDF
jgi:hypothetical protein